MYTAKNYTEQGAEKTVIGGEIVVNGKLTLGDGVAAANVAASTAGTVSALKDDVNALIVALKNAGFVTPDAWNVSVLACPDTSAMPEKTAANSAHGTFTISDDLITIALNCKVSDLQESDHGVTWGKHKWLGFGVRSGLGSVVGIKFTDDTGAEVTLSSGDASEAGTLGLSAGDFVLYIKAENPAYLAGDKWFTLWFNGYALTKFRMKITETVSA